MIKLDITEDKNDSCGLPMVNNQVMRCDDGILHVKGPALARAYLYDRKIVTIDQDSWFSSGDIGYIDPDGYVYVQGRLSNTINILGKKVSLEKTEASVRTFLSFAKCACIDYELTQGIKILVLLLERDKSYAIDKVVLFKHLKETLVPHQVPRRIDFVDFIPKRENGKVDRIALKELYKRMINEGPM